MNGRPGVNGMEAMDTVGAMDTMGAMVEVAPAGSARWTAVCAYDRLTPGRGVAALVDGRQVAVFRDRAGEVYALGNRDPFSGAYVLSRGIVGTAGGLPVVQSPMYKQRFCLRTGVCLDDDATAVEVYRARVMTARQRVTTRVPVTAGQSMTANT